MNQKPPQFGLSALIFGSTALSIVCGLIALNMLQAYNATSPVHVLAFIVVCQRFQVPWLTALAVFAGIAICTKDDGIRLVSICCSVIAGAAFLINCAVPLGVL